LDVFYESIKGCEIGRESMILKLLLGFAVEMVHIGKGPRRIEMIRVT